MGTLLGRALELGSGFGRIQWLVGMFLFTPILFASSQVGELSDGDLACQRLLELGPELFGDPSEAHTAELASECFMLLPVAIEHFPVLLDAGRLENRHFDSLSAVLVPLAAHEPEWFAEVFPSLDFDSLRSCSKSRGIEEVGARVEIYVAMNMINGGLRTEVGELLSGALEAYSEHPTAKALILVGQANLHLDLQSWAEALEVLDEADRTLVEIEDSPRSEEWYRARCESLSLRFRVESLLGRSKPALAALEAERAWARRFDADLQSPFAFVAVQSSVISTASFLSDAKRYDESVDLLENLLEDPRVHEMDRPYILMRLEDSRAALVLSGATHVDVDERRAGIAEILSFPNLPTSIRVHHLMALAGTYGSPRAGGEYHPDDLERAGEILGECQALLEEADRIGGEEDANLYSWTLLRTREAQLSRLLGAGPQELQEHLDALDDLFDLIIASISRSPVVPGGVSLLVDVDRQLALEIYVKLCFLLDQPDRALRKLSEFQAQGTLARQLGAPPPTVEAIRKELVGTGGVLLYVPSHNHTLLLAIEEGRTSIHGIIGNRDLDQLLEARNESRALGQPTSDLIDHIGRELLPEPVRELIAAWTHTYIIGSDILGHPPFEAFPFGASTFGREVACAYLPSLPIGVHLAERAKQPTTLEQGSLSLFAAPPPSPSARERWKELTELTLEREAWEPLLAPFPAERYRTWVGSKATRSALLEELDSPALAMVGGPSVLNILCHGVFDSGARVLPAGLALAAGDSGDGLVWYSDIAERDRSPDLVILAACGTARGPSRQGEDGIAHLGGAFLVAGSSTTILARDSVEVASALKASEVLHAELARGVSIAEALRRARQATTSDGQGGEGDAPLFVLGLAHRPLFTAPPTKSANSRGVLIAGLGTFSFVLLLLGLGVLRRRRRY